jgi:hypothetical protein
VSRLLLGIFLAGTLVVTIVAVVLVGPVGVVLLVLAALIAAGLLLDERLRRRMRTRGRRVAGSSSALPQTHIEPNDGTPLGASDQSHEDLSSLDLPRDAPAYRDVRRREEERRRERSEQVAQRDLPKRVGER